MAGSVSFKMTSSVKLGIGVGDVCVANAYNLFPQRWIAEQSLPPRCPISAFAAADDVIDCGQGVALVCQMAVLHRVNPLRRQTMT